jgi:cob(I)alamin adenosyltransferase
MVYLSSIYTKSGDDGFTSLGDGARVSKDDIRVAAYGAVDETNAMIGMLRQHMPPSSADWALLEHIQNDLFDLGADLCVPESPADTRQRLRLAQGQSQFVEKAIDDRNERLKPLTSFILPGGSAASCWSHLARTTCRRAERDVVTLARQQHVNPEAVIYLNRLSDLLFVLGRVYNSLGEQDILWQPGANRPK